MINQTFTLWSYVTPIVGAIIADQYLGRVNTIFSSSIIYICGLLVLYMSSLSAAADAGVSFQGLIFALFLIGSGTGGIKANVSSLIAEQYNSPDDPVRKLSSGETVVIDEDLTIQRYGSLHPTSL